MGRFDGEGEGGKRGCFGGEPAQQIKDGDRRTSDEKVLSIRIIIEFTHACLQDLLFLSWPYADQWLIFFRAKVPQVPSEHRRKSLESNHMNR